jgi:hypothetical protein
MAMPHSQRVAVLKADLTGTWLCLPAWYLPSPLLVLLLLLLLLVVLPLVKKFTTLITASTCLLSSSVVEGTRGMKVRRAPGGGEVQAGVR